MNAVTYGGLLWLALTLFSTVCYTQSQVVISGIVMDAETLEPLPHAHIIINHRLVTSPNQSGRFVFRTNHLDTITISHVSYVSLSQVITSQAQGPDSLTLAIFMEREINQLPELLITPYPATFNDFKQKVLEVDVVDPLRSFRQQQPAITYDIIMGPKVSYDAYENYRRINQPTEITLFSSGGMKGISRVLKKWRTRKKYQRKY